MKPYNIWSSWISSASVTFRPSWPSHGCTPFQDLHFWGGSCPTRSQQPSVPCLLRWRFFGVFPLCPNPCPVLLLLFSPASSLRGFIHVVCTEGLDPCAQCLNCHSSSCLNLGKVLAERTPWTKKSPKHVWEFFWGHLSLPTTNLHLRQIKRMSLMFLVFASFLLILSML